MASSSLPRRLLLALTSRGGRPSSLPLTTSLLPTILPGKPFHHHDRLYHGQVRRMTSSTTTTPAPTLDPGPAAHRAGPDIIPAAKKAVKPASAAKAGGVSGTLFEEKASQVERCVELISSRIGLEW